ncbi:AAA family ATPase [Deltaproteobacteria bacterium]|nr:AAA family ATPase [Deltaproteobacteria bacterium]
MTTYTTKEQWQSLYDDSVISGLRKVAIDKLQKEGNQVYPGTENAAKEIWALCVAVADKIKNKHTEIYTSSEWGLGEGGYRYFSVTSASITDQTITVSVNSEDVYDLKYFIDNLSFFNNKYHGYVNVMHRKNGTNRLLRITHVLPMLSLGIFQASGKNWIDIGDLSNKNKNFRTFQAGRPGKNDLRSAVSLTGHFDNKQEMIDIINLGEKMNNQISEIVDLLELRKNVILEGVPGTGKTWIRNEIRKKMGATLETTTFHPAKSYEEFVGGIFPQNNAGELQFHYLEGTVSKIANKAMKDTDGEKYILFIDEINRANIPLVMGELLTIIESTKRTEPDGDDALKDKPTDKSTWEVAVHTEPNLTKYLRLPSNLYFLATMNTSDRSVLSMDAALRRRFAYYRIETKLIPAAKSEMKKLLQPSESGEPETFWNKRKLFNEGGLFEKLFDILADINQNILKKKIGPDAMLGHSYFFVGEDEVASLSNEEAVSEILQLSILPQIADILTSMNKTEFEIVNEINTKLKPLEDLGASLHRLKEPIVNNNSLDVAVTVVQIIDSENYSNLEELFNKDNAIFRHTQLHRGGSRPQGIPEYAYIRHIGPNKEVEILAGSAIIPPSKGFAKKYLTDEGLRKDWIKEKTISLIQDEYGIFNQNQKADTSSLAGRIVFGSLSFRGPEFKNKSGKRFPTKFE